MMNSKRDLSPEEVLDTIMGLLNKERMAIEIDEPINKAAQDFYMEVTAPISHAGFNGIITAFVQHVYHQGLRLPRCLPDQEAFSETIFLLNRYYRGEYTWGYDGALLDVTGGKLEGLEVVLSRIAELIKAVERKKYVQWVLISNIDPLDWATRYQLVSAYLKQYKNFIPLQLKDIDPARLTEHLHDLIINHVSTDILLSRVLGLER